MQYASDAKPIPIEEVMEDLRCLDVNQVSEVLQVTPKCLQKWRTEGRGPRYVKTDPTVRNCRILYPVNELYKWMNSRMVYTEEK